MQAGIYFGQESFVKEIFDGVRILLGIGVGGQMDLRINLTSAKDVVEVEAELCKNRK